MAVRKRQELAILTCTSKVRARHCCWRVIARDTRASAATAHHVPHPHDIRTCILDSAYLLDRQVRPARAGTPTHCAFRRTHSPTPLQVYALHLRLFYSAKLAQQKKLKNEILVNKKELLQTSAQDQFAKWAKLRRSVDKGLAELEKLSESPVPCCPCNVARSALRASDYLPQTESSRPAKQPSRSSLTPSCGC